MSIEDSVAMFELQARGHQGLLEGTGMFPAACNHLCRAFPKPIMRAAHVSEPGSWPERVKKD